MAKSKPGISENQVVSLWQQRMQANRRLVDTLGRPIEVIYPGRCSDTRGGDFRDALVNLAGVFHSGNIEIHTLNGNWLTHRHHKDPLYNSVILHVAFQSDRAIPTVLQKGKIIPTVILNELKSDPARCALPCANILNQKDTASFNALLEEYGWQRLEAKALKFQSEMSFQPAEQVLYSGIFEALGYTKNQKPFRQLAAALPLKTLCALTNQPANDPDRIMRLEACLLGSAGLLPSQRGLPVNADKVMLQYEELWQELAGVIQITDCAWELFKVRPANSPLRRLAAVARLVARFSQAGWLESILPPLIFSSAEKIASRLIQVIQVDDGGYWSSHFDFACSSLCSAALIGRQRSAEIAVNVILPFALAWSRCQQYALEDRIKQVYSSFPALPSNSIERHMLEQLGTRGKVTLKACSQQGLLQIYKSACTVGGCASCKFGGGS